MSDGEYMYNYSLFNLGAKWGWVVNATPLPLHPRKRPGTLYIGGWVCPGADLGGNLIPGPTSP